MKKIILRVISKPEPSSCAIIEFTNDGKINGRTGEVALVCGKCGKSLAENIEDGQLRNLVLRCKCGAYNSIPLTWNRFRLFDIKENYNIWALLVGFILLIISQFIEKRYSVVTFWAGLAGLLVSILSTLFLLRAKKTTRYFSE